MFNQILKIILNSKQFRQYILLTLFFGFLLFTSVFGRGRVFFQTQVYATGRGIDYGFHFLFPRRAAMIDSNAQLKTQVSVLTQKNDDLAALEQENKELAAALEIKSAKPTLFANSKVAYIGNRTLRDSEQSMLINLGSADGVKLNQIATTTDGQLIGYIDEVSTTSATLRLLQDIQSKVPIKVLETKNTEGIIEGQTGFTLALNYVPTTSDLKAEQIVVTSGLDGRFPANLVVGKVGKVTKTESNPFQSAEVIPGVDVRKITTVLILNL